MAQPTTFGELKRLIADEPRGNWPSRVNPGMTHAQALKVLGDGLARFADDMPISDYILGDLYRRNVLRECNSRRREPVK